MVKINFDVIHVAAFSEVALVLLSSTGETMPLGHQRFGGAQKKSVSGIL
jgi:hypothetical protein